jgi:hypothetical protein
MPSQGARSETDGKADGFSDQLLITNHQLLTKNPEERAEKGRAPPLTSHNRPGKRFAAALDSAPHKPNQTNDK